jgi:hypothetical protein
MNLCRLFLGPAVYLTSRQQMDCGVKFSPNCLPLPPETHTHSRVFYSVIVTWVPTSKFGRFLYRCCFFDNLLISIFPSSSFRFSLGFSCLVKRFLAPDPRKRRLGGGSPHYHGGVPRGLGPLTPDTPSNEFFLPQDDWSLVSKIAIASLSSQVRFTPPPPLTIPNTGIY